MSCEGDFNIRNGPFLESSLGPLAMRAIFYTKDSDTAHDVIQVPSYR